LAKAQVPADAVAKEMAARVSWAIRWAGLTDSISESSWKRQLDAPAGAVIGEPGKTERCGSSSTCVLLDSAKKARLRRACTLQGRRRGGPLPCLPARRSNAAWRVERGAGGCIPLTQGVNLISIVDR
jgi:hypothetical protein